MMESDDNCSAHFDVGAGTDQTDEFWIVVDGNGSKTDGFFGLTIFCYEAPTPTPSLPPTPEPSEVPTPQPTPLPSFQPTPYPTTQPCAFNYLECGGSFRGNTLHSPNIQSYPGGDASFMVNPRGQGFFSTEKHTYTFQSKKC